MSSNPYINYYVNQAGTGIGGFQGARFQRGQGFFGNVFKSAILPLLKYFGKKALNTGVDVAKDAIGGENILKSIKMRGKDTVKGIASDAAERATRFALTGKGRQSRKRKSAKGKNKRVKRKTKRIKRRKETKKLSVFS